MLLLLFQQLKWTAVQFIIYYDLTLSDVLFELFSIFWTLPPSLGSELLELVLKSFIKHLLHRLMVLVRLRRFQRQGIWFIVFHGETRVVRSRRYFRNALIGFWFYLINLLGSHKEIWVVLRWNWDLLLNLVPLFLIRKLFVLYLLLMFILLCNVYIWSLLYWIVSFFMIWRLVFVFIVGRILWVLFLYLYCIFLIFLNLILMVRGRFFSILALWFLWVMCRRSLLEHATLLFQRLVW